MTNLNLTNLNPRFQRLAMPALFLVLVARGV